MPLIVVEQEENAAALVARLLRARTSKSAAERAVSALRESNPGLDLDRLTPGTIVVVPELKGARASVGDLAGPAAAGVVDPLKASLTALSDGARAALETDRAQRAETAGVFDAEEVRQAAERDPVLRDVLEALRRTLGEDDERAVRSTDALLAEIDGWNQDLDRLGRLL